MDEIKTFDDALIIQRKLMCVDERRHLPHSHHSGQLVLVRHGVLCGYTSHQQWLLKAGMAVWIPPEVVHGGQAYHGVDLTVLYLPATLCLTFSTPADIKLMNASLLITALCDRLMMNTPLLSAGRRHGILQMLFDEVAEMPISHLTLPLPSDPRLKKVTDSLVADPAERKSLAEWGKQVGATERTLARLFRKETGLRFTQWYNRLLLSEAWRGLGSGASNEQLAMSLGFASCDSFGHWFRRVTGDCPGKVRKYLQSLPGHDAVRDKTRQ